MKFTFEILETHEIKKYVSDFRNLEKNIKYPLEDGYNTFTIDHGPTYHTFFSQQGHKARFMAIMHNSLVIGTLAATWKKILIKRKYYNAIYFGDLKLHKSYRKKGVINKLFWYLFTRWPFNKKFKNWDFAYYCAMLKSGKGVEHSFKNLNPAKLASPSAIFNIYMEDPLKIDQLNWNTKLIDKTKNTINLSPLREESIFWNDGNKNIISNNGIIPLAHLHPNFFEYPHSKEHKEHINKIIKRKKALACFGIDIRNKHLIQWLKSHQILTNTKCKIFSFSPFAPSLKKANMLYISTGEI